MAWLGLAGKRAVITGGSSGIGRATAVGLLRAGVHVTIVDINVDKVTFTLKIKMIRVALRYYLVVLLCLS